MVNITENGSNTLKGFFPIVQNKVLKVKPFYGNPQFMDHDAMILLLLPFVMCLFRASPSGAGFPLEVADISWMI